jgi:hypothetical protein
MFDFERAVVEDQGIPLKEAADFYLGLKKTARLITRSDIKAAQVKSEVVSHAARQPVVKQASIDPLAIARMRMKVAYLKLAANEPGEEAQMTAPTDTQQMQPQNYLMA